MSDRLTTNLSRLSVSPTGLPFYSRESSDLPYPNQVDTDLTENPLSPDKKQSHYLFFLLYL